MSLDAVKTVPEPTLKRLPLYHRFAKSLQQTGRASVSCTDIGAELKLDPTQVRKDLEAAGLNGRPRVGYPVASIVDGLEAFLGWNKVNEAFLVGAGSLGSALLGYHKFEECGLKIVAAFDASPERIGRKIHGKHVLAVEKLPGLARRMHVLIGIITVPAEQAQAVADELVAGGIRAIWNFAPVRLRLPADIIVHNEDLYCSLASLSQKLAKALETKPAPQPRPEAAPAAAAGKPAANDGGARVCAEHHSQRPERAGGDGAGQPGARVGAEHHSQRLPTVTGPRGHSRAPVASLTEP